MSARLGPSGLKYATFSDPDDIARISAQWDRLLSASTCNRAFASHEWYRASCRYHASLDPFLIAAFREDDVVAILPLALDRDEHVARFPHYVSDYNDIVVRRDDLAVVAGLMVHAISTGVCRRMVLSRLRADSNCICALPFVAALAELRYCCREIDRHYTINLPSSFDDYVASRTKAFRTNLKQALRRMERGDLTASQLNPDDFESRELPEFLISMARARQGQGSLFYRPEAISFIREVLPLVFRKRGIIASRLAQGEQPVGAYVHVLGDKGLGAWNGGFLPEVSRSSPGTLLLAHGIQQAIKMEFQEYDFLRGSEPYKMNWANGHYGVFELEMVRT